MALSGCVVDLLSVLMKFVNTMSIRLLNAHEYGEQFLSFISFLGYILYSFIINLNECSLSVLTVKLIINLLEYWSFSHNGGECLLYLSWVLDRI